MGGQAWFTWKPTTAMIPSAEPSSAVSAAAARAAGVSPCGPGERQRRWIDEGGESNRFAGFVEATGSPTRSAWLRVWNGCAASGQTMREEAAGETTTTDTQPEGCGTSSTSTSEPASSGRPEVWEEDVEPTVFPFAG